MESEKELVCITGITGYLGTMVCKAFLENGCFRVRGTVRSKANPEKMEPLKKAFGEHFDQLEIVEADLLDKDSLFKAIEGCQYVVHTASPFPIKKPKHEDDLIKPAVEGTTAAVEAAIQNKVKRIVITASVASIMATKDKTKTNFSNKDFSDPDACDPYSKSKTLAEQAAWEIQKKQEGDYKIEIVTIHPGLILGPNYNTGHFSSGDIIGQFMEGKMPMYPKLGMSLVDVRDCAKAHLQGILVPEAANKRFVLVADSLWMGDIAKILNEKYGDAYKKIPKKEAPKILINIMSLFKSEMKFVKNNWGIKNHIDAASTKEILGVDFIEPKQSLIDMVPTLAETGHIKNLINKE